MYLLYSALLALGILVGTPYWLFEMVRHGKYREGLLQRLGRIPRPLLQSDERSIWVHAVSVGEVLAVTELVRRIGVEFADYRTVITTTTDTGQKLAINRFGADNVCYFPLDFAFAVRRYLAALRPELIVIAETEFWPNLLRIARASGAQVAVVNARISDRSLPGYRRWRKVLRPVLANIGVFIAQTSEDERRLTEIGAPADRIVVGGNLKFDVTLPPAPPIVDDLKASLSKSGAGPVFVCGSTVEGEEPWLIEAFKQALARYPAAVMLLAPRHPERFGEVASLLQESGIKFCKRSQWDYGSLNGGMLLVDSIGELSTLYGLADLAVVGGSFVPRGGHNILEPAQQGVPIIVGPHTENFRDIINLFQRNDAVRVVAPSDLAAAFLEFLANENERRALGRRALQTAESQRGATQFTLEKLRALLPPRAREVHSV